MFVRAGMFCLFILICINQTTLFASEWRYHSGDAGGTRYSELDQIHRDNVQQLERAWVYRTGDMIESSAHYFECTPLVVDNVMYIITTFSNLVALDATTGEELWTFEPAPPLLSKETGAGGLASRGVAYWEDGDQKRIFHPVRDGRLYSIDIETGKPDETFGDGGFINLRQGLPNGGTFLFLSSPPVVYENLVIQGFGINDTSAETFPHVPLRAYDTRTGEVVWSFNTIPQEGEFGVETWQEDSWKTHGGCNVWSIMTVDEENEILFIPVGAPNFDKYGRGRPGKNLFGNCVVALNVNTGERIWHFQIVHHDLWDYDVAAAPVLTTVQKEGESIPTVAVLGKTGFTYLFHRLTGEPIFPIEEYPVPQSNVPGEMSYPTQPFPSKPPAFSRQHLTPEGLHQLSDESYEELKERLAGYRSEGLFTPPTLEGTIVYPGQLGGANWSGAAVSPDGMLYVNVNELAYVVNLVEADNPFGYNAHARHFRDENGLPAVKPPWGTLTKIDLNEGEIVWQKPLGHHPKLSEDQAFPSGTMNFGGATVTTGGLVVIGSSMDEKLHIFDAESGEIIFQDQMEAAGQGAPVTYLGTDGNQYITICAGGGGKAGTPAGDYVIGYRLKQD